MNKLMIAAVAAVVAGGAFAECSYIPTPKTTTADAAWAYKWKFSGKTTKAVNATCNNQGYVTRTSTSLKIQGWSFYCEPECGDFEAAKADEIFWQTKPSKRLFAEAGVTLEIANQIGKKGKNYEAFGVAEFDDLYVLYFAGFGKYNKDKARVTSIKGNFAGVAAAPASGGDDCHDGEASKVWECCGCPTLDADSIAYGKWSVKYNKSYAKKYAAGTLKPEKVYPKWAR